jgi:predicted nucleotidyltransferase
MDILNPEFVNFIICANENSLRYLVIGGFAVNYHGYSRNTADLDIWIAPTNDNKLALIKTMHCMGYTADETAEIAEENFETYFKASLGTSEASIDLMTFVDKAIFFDDAESNKKVFIAENGMDVNFIDLNTLLNVKAKAARAKDLTDIENLLKINNQQ